VLPTAAAPMPRTLSARRRSILLKMFSDITDAFLVGGLHCLERGAVEHVERCDFYWWCLSSVR
jgi:hypothetical protein